MAFRFISCHPIQRNFLGRLTFNAVSWGEVINGNSALTGTIPLPSDETKVQSLLLATEPDEAAVYVQDSLNRFVWGGVVVGQAWNPKQRTIEVAVADWRSYFYSVLLSPKIDLTSDNVYNWAAKDQLQIAREIAGYATLSNGGTLDGRPVIQIGAETSGILRDLTCVGLDFKTSGELLDSMAQRDDGFEWDIDFVTDTSTGLPVLKFSLYYPERGANINSFGLRSTEDSGNFEVVGSINKSSAERRTRVWTTGSTSGPRQEFAQDSDPAIPNGFTLLREKHVSHSTVTDRTTLSLHAVAQRQFDSVKNNFIHIRMRMLSDDGRGIDPDSFRAGDRVNVRLQDLVYDMDLPAVRIIAREMRPYEGGGTMDCILDLSDFKEPEAVG